MSGPANPDLRTHRDIERDTYPGKDRQNHPPEPGTLSPERIAQDEQGTGNQQGINAERPRPGKDRINQ